MHIEAYVVFELVHGTDKYEIGAQRRADVYRRRFLEHYPRSGLARYDEEVIKFCETGSDIVAEPAHEMRFQRATRLVIEG